MRRFFIVASLVLSVALGARAQDAKQEAKPEQQVKPPEVHAQAGESTLPKEQPAARPGDVDTMEHLIAAVYDAISGPVGDRDWNRFRSLFYKDARLIPSGRHPDGTVGARVLPIEDYIERARPIFLKEGFYERAAFNKVEQYDHMAHVWSTYESRHKKEDKEPFQRGINSFQLMNDGKRWWVLNVYWEAEDAGHPIPAQYVDGAAAKKLPASEKRPRRGKP